LKAKAKHKPKAGSSEAAKKLRINVRQEQTGTQVHINSDDAKIWL
jgi:hypothetical protein